MSFLFAFFIIFIISLPFLDNFRGTWRKKLLILLLISLLGFLGIYFIFMIGYGTIPGRKKVTTLKNIVITTDLNSQETNYIYFFDQNSGLRTSDSLSLSINDTVSLELDYDLHVVKIEKNKKSIYVRISN